MHFGPKLLAQPRKELRHKIQILLRRPTIFRRQASFRRLVVHLPAADPIGAVESRDSRLRANRFVSKLQVMRDRGERIFDVGPTGVPIYKNGIARCAAEKLIQRCIEAFRFDVPQSRVHRRDR
jgi:hypothetical protein